MHRTYRFCRNNPFLSFSLVRARLIDGTVGKGKPEEKKGGAGLGKGSEEFTTVTSFGYTHLFFLLEAMPFCRSSLVTHASLRCFDAR